MTDKELYELAKAGHPDCIPGLLNMITEAAMEILRLEYICEEHRKTPREISLEFQTFMKRLNITRVNEEGLNKRYAKQIAFSSAKPVRRSLSK